MQWLAFEEKTKKISMRIFGINLFSLFSSKFCGRDHETEIWNWLIITQKVVSSHLYIQWYFIVYFSDVIGFILLSDNWATFFVLLFLLSYLQVISHIVINRSKRFFFVVVIQNCSTQRSRVINVTKILKEIHKILVKN